MIAVGTDILKVERIDEVVARLGDKFVQRILTESEQTEYRASKQSNRLLAKRFAAKEAIAKALGTGIGRGVSWQDIQVVAGADPRAEPGARAFLNEHALGIPCPTSRRTKRYYCSPAEQPPLPRVLYRSLGQHRLSRRTPIRGRAVPFPRAHGVQRHTQTFRLRDFTSH